MSVTPLQLTDQAAAKGRRGPIIAFDPLLMLAAVGLMACSIATLHAIRSATIYHGLYSRQIIYAVIGLTACLIVSRFDYSRVREYRYGFYGLLIVLNLVVYGMPAESGARRWIPLPGFQFQSSEFGKLLLILSLAAFAVDRARAVSDRRTTARILLMALIPAMLVIEQPDLGTGLIYVTVGVAMIFFVGASWKHLVALAALFGVAVTLVLAVAPAVGVNVLQTYQKQRLTTFINPPPANRCPASDSTCYQLYQGEIAIGAGQKTGQGAKGASQITGTFVPEGENDFVFAAVGDVYGFAGAALVLSLYALLIWRALRILTMAKNLYGTLIAGGILAMLMFQVFLNVGMTIGVMPVTGVPLPLMSYGGSSVLVTFLAVGLLQSIYIQSRIAASNKARVLVV
jgi:rod shape determining protein RodA